MKNAVVVESNDIEKILAEKFNVPEENIVKSQYSWTVILEKGEEDNDTILHR